MPLKKRFKPRRKVAKKKAYKRTKVAQLSGKDGSFIAQSAQTRHIYGETINVATFAGVINDHIYNLNSVFDPNYTGGGHQPLGRDQMATFYNRYRVDKVHVSAEFIKITDSIIGFHGIAANNTATAFINPISGLMEQPNSKSSATSATLSGAKTNLHYKRMYDLASITGVSKAIYKSDDRYQALETASPSEVIALHLLGCDLQEAANYAYVIRLRLVYYTTWFDPKPIAQS